MPPFLMRDEEQELSVALHASVHRNAPPVLTHGALNFMLKASLQADSSGVSSTVDHALHHSVESVDIVVGVVCDALLRVRSAEFPADSPIRTADLRTVEFGVI